MRGRDKLLEHIEGEPLLLRTVRRALATGSRVMVTSSLDHPGRAAVLDRLDHPGLVRLAPMDAQEGMAVSIRAAAKLMRGMTEAPDGIMIMLADMPDVTTDDMNRMIEAFSRAPSRVHRATTSEGHPGHPVIFPARLLVGLAGTSGDTGARQLVSGEDVVTVTLPGNHALTDLDTPEDWDAWLRENGPETRLDD